MELQFAYSEDPASACIDELIGFDLSISSLNGKL
jgi:phosphatidylglycerophosphatase A